MDLYQQDIFNAYSLINESKKTKKDNDLPKSSDKKLPKNAQLASKTTGPTGKFKKAKEISEGVEKNAKRALNNFMSKSAFDKLFEQAMTDDEALGLPPADDAGAGDDLGDGDLGGDAGLTDEPTDDSVTFTLDRATAQALHAALGSVLDTEPTEGDDLGGDLGDDLGGDDLSDDLGDDDLGDDSAFKEGVDIKELGDKGTQMTKPGHKEVKGAVPVSKGKANGSVTGPSDLKAAKTSYDDGKSMKVGKLKTGDDFFNA